ncbi:hypothetical protein [Agarivorans gilvus]|uniref:Channel forming colicins domain-containing protein n=1 Tax=Agarivorans gilvus TaxID=680279 RepID=A0ABQ1I0L2_9ALTE|nr:hypothetical protein [Agarivorans gilvus]GGB01946.1 hypothetical protein GCM10007414_13970 [Agarivorans gilvus]
MSEILLCNQPTKVDFLSKYCGIDSNLIHAKECSKPVSISAFTPYALGPELNTLDSHIISRLSTPKVANNLTNLSLSFGADNTIALAEMTKKLQEYNVGLVGASTSVYANRLGGFAGAVKQYQDALMAYRGAMNSNAATKTIAKQKAFKAFQNLQFRFRQELNAINVGVRARRGTPLSSATRATNIARSSRNVVKLNVTSQVQAHNLVKFTQHAKFLGNGLAVIDFTSRIGNVHSSYKAGGEWERELFIESSSFAFSAIAGSIALKAGLGLLMVATPVGWVGLIVGGLAVAGTAAAVSIGVNGLVKENSGSWYDSIMKSIGIL